MPISSPSQYLVLWILLASMSFLLVKVLNYIIEHQGFHQHWSKLSPSFPGYLEGSGNLLRYVAHCWLSQFPALPQLPPLPRAQQVFCALWPSRTLFLVWAQSCYSATSEFCISGIGYAYKICACSDLKIISAIMICS